MNLRAANVDGPAPLPDEETTMSEKTLLDTLVRELFQSERSAQRHGLIEADRLGLVPPAAALRAVARDADLTLRDLPGFCRKQGLPVSAGGLTLGTLFSVLRTSVGDRLLDKERSYRGTLLGMRHGVDLVRLLRSAARADKHKDLAVWCEAWLERREPLVDDVAHHLAWFGRHPGQALAPAEGDSWLGRAGRLMEGLTPPRKRLRRDLQA